jgi:hypothetical protein
MPSGEGRYQAAAQVTDVRRADPTARRQAGLVLAVGALVGALVIAGFERYRIPLRDWMAEPGASAQRVQWVFVALAACLVAPLLAFSAYVWSLGARVRRAREFPPPSLRVIRDTPLITGERAISRARLLQVIALGCGVASLALGLLLCRLAWLLGSRPRRG